MNYYKDGLLPYVKQEILSCIDDHGKDFNVSDVSDIKDNRESLLIQTETQNYLLFIPNSWYDEGELTTKYTLILDDEYAFEHSFQITLKDLEEVINYILFQLA